MTNIIEFELLDILEKTKNWRYLRDYLRKLADNKDSINVKEYLLKKVNSKTILQRLAYNYKKIGYMESINVLREIIIEDEELLKECLKIGFIEILEKLDPKVFEKEIDNTTLIEYLFENKLVTKKHLGILLSCENIFYYLKKYKHEYLLKYINLEELLLKEKDNKLYLDEFIESQIYWEFYKMDIKLIEEIVKRKQYNLLANLEEWYLLLKINNETILEILLKNNIHPNLEEYEFSESFQIISKYKKYELLLNSNINELVIKNKEGNFIIEELLQTGLIPYDREFIDPNVVYYIIKTKRTDLYSKLNLRTLITNGDLNNKFLDIILEEAKLDKTIKLPKVKVSHSVSLNFEELARIYICYAKHDMQGKLRQDIGAFFVSNRPRNKVFLEYLLEEDEQVTKDKIISHLLEYDEIKTILKLHEYKKGFPSIKIIYDDIINEQLDSYKIDEENPEIKELIDELIELYTDEYKDEKVLNILRINFTYLCHKDEKFIIEVKKLIKLKKENPFIQLSKTKEESHYIKGRVFVEDEVLYILNHEMGHLYFEYLCKYRFPYEFDREVSKLQFSDEFMKEKLVSFSTLANDIANQISEEASLIIEKLYENESEEYRKEIEEYLNNVDLPEWIQRNINRNVLTEEYHQKDKRIKKERLKLIIMRCRFPEICIISDIIDEITFGKYGSFRLRDKENKILNCLFGHGEAYFRGDKYLIFNELFANYLALIKLKNSEEHLLFLRQIVGDGIIDMLDNYYKEHILNEEITLRR